MSQECIIILRNKCSYYTYFKKSFKGTRHLRQKFYQNTKLTVGTIHWHLKVKLIDNQQMVCESSRMVTTGKEGGVEHREPWSSPLYLRVTWGVPTLTAQAAIRGRALGLEAKALGLAAIIWNPKAEPVPCGRLYIHKLTCQTHDQPSHSQLTFLICP